MKFANLFCAAAGSLVLFSCENKRQVADTADVKSGNQKTYVDSLGVQQRLDKYVSVKLTSDLSQLTANERKMLPLLIDAAKIMDDIFWYEAYGNRDSLLQAAPD